MSPLPLASGNSLAIAPDVAEGRLLDIGGYAAVVYFVDPVALLFYRKLLSPDLAWVRAKSAIS